MKNNYKKYYKSPIGLLEIIYDENYINSVELIENIDFENNQNDDMGEKAIKQLKEYFLGQRKKFDLPLNFKGTDFQIKVWRELEKIPYGETRTYKEIGINVGCPKGARAIGNANNKNPFIIVVPCHRVIGSNGKLVGYAKGLNIKKYLLELEMKGVKCGN
ncbi:methylated-DNA--[protein]-cysteine S-methyltransferase [Fusobacterium perfoetens]|uniref:methylated-DNA--[protein]-cysteine S-methyltransferase n=1 Tax=Fusobacterium perfoetens TaxID=852 RepID=UPI000486E0D1|nr:methylated-DNA--[protein]-cysteine S-methyltransferase [Fusobacterium perfoetens]MCI6152025.1 methylated-DNA--[protein]-cysteine S-methyltransferase [Fusobacterium perfoetens]MDY3238084.1 methylated-DNA--[protein]-cysteine S-methyltransferase [Fusobacterium perfoetens]